MRLDQIRQFAMTSRGLLLLGFGLSFIHLFWYASPWTAWLALVCYAPFLAWLRLFSHRPFVAGLCFGLWYALMNCYWLGQFVGKWTQSALVGGSAVLVVGLIWGFFFGLAAWGVKWAQARGEFAGFLAMLGFPIADVARQYIAEFNFPFTPLGEPLIAYPILALGLRHSLYAPICVSLVAHLICDLKGRRYFQSAAVLLAIRLVINPVFSYSTLRDQKVPTRIALGQLGFDLAYSEEGLKPSRLREAIADLTAQAKSARADVLILPEAVASFQTQPTTVFDLPADLPILFGAQRGTSPRYQSAYLWDGKRFQHTDKTKLVVFGEYVPFRGVLPYPKGFQLPAGDLREGDHPEALTLPNGQRIGAMICFESLFAGAGENLKKLNVGFITIMSLDDWYMGTNAIPRLEVAARWRAVETRKWIFRVGSLGKTMVIDPDGRVQRELPTGERKLLVFDLK